MFAYASPQLGIHHSSVVGLSGRDNDRLLELPVLEFLTTLQALMGGSAEWNLLRGRASREQHSYCDRSGPLGEVLQAFCLLKDYQKCDSLRSHDISASRG